MNVPPPAFDLPRITLGVLAIGVMTAASIWVMLPFLLSVVWAAMIVIATWPILVGIQSRLGGRRAPARLDRVPFVGERLTGTWQEFTGNPEAVVALTLDNVLRPVLIKRGADLPLILILSGVIGGVMAFGLIGLFIGPVLLAVTWTIVVAWVGDVDRAPHPAETEETQ